MGERTKKLWTVNSIKEAVRATGSHWFDPSTMRFFGTRVLPEVFQGPGGIYFVTSEKPPHGPRECTVRKFVPETADIETVGELASKSRHQANKIARNMAAGGDIGLVVRHSDEPFRPVSVLDQFAHDIQQHTRPERGTESDTVAVARALMKLAKLHHRYMEMLCSDEAFCRQLNADGEHPRVEATQRKISGIVASIGAAALFSGDPRGCTVKLVFPDGATNDFGKEGWCVPTDERGS